jgi:hypothetical protein
MTPLWRATVEACARAYGITPVEITRKGKFGGQAVSDARAVAWYVIHIRDRKGYTAIGRLLGGIDHSSVMTGVRRASKMLVDGDALATEIIGAEMLRDQPDMPKFVPTDPAIFAAKHKPRNEPSCDDTDALERLRGSEGLIAAIRREFPQRFAA